MRRSILNSLKRLLVIFHSGFCLKNDEKFFEKYLDQGDYCMAGFSYGAIKAFEAALMSKRRIDTLQLFSPAFFQTKNERYIAMQLGAFSADEAAYLRLFVDNCFSPALNDGSADLAPGTYQELKQLLTYVWDKKKIEQLKEKGVHIEVYLGEKDKIIDAKKAYEFFSPLVEVFYIKETGHFLKRKID